MTLDVDGLIHEADGPNLPPAEALAKLASLIDLAGDLRRIDAIEAAIKWSGRLVPESLSVSERALAHYFAANAHATRRTLSPPDSVITSWTNPDLEDEIRHLRLALQSGGLEVLHPDRYAQVRTNLGNALGRCGRHVEALEWYDVALAESPSFGMAIANRGLTLVSYSNLTHDAEKRNAIVREAHRALRLSLEYQLEGEATTIVGSALERLESRAPAGFSWDQPVSGGALADRSEEAWQYREWCRASRLFLDEFNDLKAPSVAARDTLSLPGYIVPLDEGPRFIGLFNQLKQEYVAARWILFEGIRNAEGHPADRDVLLADTLDYPAYSFGTEQLRLAFRSSYSLFDKVAFFLNHYLQLGIPDNKVAYRTLWFSTQAAEMRPHPAIEARLDGPLRAMLWVGKDLFEPSSEYGSALLPDAQELWEIRRHLEHRYLKIHGEGWTKDWNADGSQDGLCDDLAFSVGRADFEQKALRLLAMVRALLIYLTWTMYAEEDSRRRSGASGAVVPTTTLYPVTRNRIPNEGVPGHTDPRRRP